ncbi:hypothetical protein SAMN05720766_101261 [Fibrobacter sp. UWH9]|nr:MULTISPECIES: hypothetical protein [unclassified Fibrobacter]OWV05783.1 hypothetical protein B7993_07380 [Fibrobacter sp. UWH3]SHG34841.1 hypothetical protein SAMN05720766_101261 [Fibrobacter sp. UWH9]SHK31482.1 hypothetical protein SAMN05720764_101140 [Fibrobacter sp. UWH5]
MRNVLVLMIAILVCTLVGCSQSYHWTKSHPAYHKAPYGELAVAGVQDAFVLTRTSWFAKRLDFGDSTQIKSTEFCAQIMLDELRGGYSKLNVLSEKVLAGFPEESQKLDDRIFMKGKLPEQGVVVKDSAGKVPPEILLIHEVIVGTDLKREDYFDYALIHNESQEKSVVQNISAIVSYTLWDNLKQRPLFSAVDEIQHPIVKFSLQDLELLVRASVRQIRSNLYTGVNK